MSTNEQALRDTIRAAGGIVHSDGNIFFTNAGQFRAAALTLSAAAVDAQAAPDAVSDAEIREVFLANGFTVKDGQTDLKPYVFAAARAILARFAAPANAAKARTAGVVEVCPDCDIADCHHIRAQRAAPASQVSASVAPAGWVMVPAMPLSLIHI